MRNISSLCRQELHSALDAALHQLGDFPEVQRSSSSLSNSQVGIFYIYMIIGILFNDILCQIPKFKMESIINVMGYYRWQLEKFTCLDDNYIDISRNFFFDGVVQRSSWKCVMINSWGSLEPKSYVDRRYGIITKPRSLEASKPRRGRAGILHKCRHRVV